MADNASASAKDAVTRLSAEAVAAVERILADGRRVEIIRGEKSIIVKEVTRRTAYKSYLT